MFGITSEPHSLASEAESAWEMSIPVIGDPHHEIRQNLKERGMLDVYYNENYGHLRARSWASHPNGYYQPAVIAIDKTGRILYRWRCVPKYSNMSGAGARPSAEYTWDAIRKGRGSTEDAALDRTPEMGAQTLSWPKFLLLLTAHGWFLRPKAFPLTRAGDRQFFNRAGMMRRIYGFAALWLVLLIVLPIGWFGLALLAWLAALTPGLIEIHRQFQNEPAAY